MKSSDKEVLTLEIQDEPIRAIFSAVKGQFRHGRVPRSPHLTIRGPYSKHVPQNVTTKVSDILGTNTIFEICGVGRFDNQKEHIVYLKISDKNLKLRKVWWKPDFPMKQYGFNPHITVFRGAKDDADKVHEFLLSQHIQLPINNFQLRTDKIGNNQSEFDF